MNPPVCPDCNEPITATICLLGPNPNPEAAAVLAEIMLAAHRKLAHGKKRTARAVRR